MESPSHFLIKIGEHELCGESWICMCATAGCAELHKLACERSSQLCKQWFTTGHTGPGCLTACRSTSSPGLNS